MNKGKRSVLAEASTKSVDRQLTVQLTLPALELILQTKAEIEALSAQAGLTIIQSLMEQEVQERCGPWGSQSAFRHGKQNGYVIYAGRKVTVNKPRVRGTTGTEVPLESYRAFQQD